MLVVEFTDVEPDAPAVVTPEVLLVTKLSDCGLKEAPVEEETTDLDAPDVLTAVWPTFPVRVTLPVPFPRTVASVAFTVPAKAVVSPVPAEVVELPALLEPPVPAEAVLLIGRSQYSD